LKYFSFIGKASIVRVLVHDLEIATVGTKIGEIVTEIETETGIATAIGIGIVSANGTVSVNAVLGIDETETEIVMAIGTEIRIGETEIEIGTEEEKGH